MTEQDIDLDNVSIEEYPNVLRERADEVAQESPVGGSISATVLCTVAAELDYMIHGEQQEYEFKQPTMTIAGDNEQVEGKIPDPEQLFG